MLAEDGEGSMETGERLLLAGLYIQLGFFTMFAIMLLVLHINPKVRSTGPEGVGHVAH